MVPMGTTQANVRIPEWRRKHTGRANEALAQFDQEEGGHPVEFARLAHTFEELERTSSRLALIELLTQLFRSIERPEEIEQVCYLVQGRVAPFFEALEMGMAEKSVARSIAMAYNATLEHIAALYAALCDLGLVAGKVKSEAGHTPHVLNVDEVFEGLRTIAQTAGKGAVEQRIARLSDL